MRSGGREAIMASARRRLASALSFMGSERMILVRSGLTGTSIRVGREFIRLGGCRILPHVVRMRRRIEEGVGRIRPRRDRRLVLVGRGIHDGLLSGKLKV
jgi:hypothetical protein